jgi:hypothetical protein
VPGALLVVLALSGCEDRARPWSGDPDGGVVDESEPFLPRDPDAPLYPDAGGEPADAAPVAEPLGASRAGGLWVSCYRGFAPEGHPLGDVTRLGLLCGPANGMRMQGDTGQGEVGEGRPPSAHPMKAKKGSCYRIFAVAEASVRDLDVTVRSSRQSRLTTDDSDDHWPILEPERPFCTFADDAFTVDVTAGAGSGRYALQIWELPPR